MAPIRSTPIIVPRTWNFPGWERPASVPFPGSSAFDPVNRFPVRRIVKAVYMEYDILLPAGRVIARL